MPVFRLTDEPIFPPPEAASPSGLLAVGGDLSTERLILAYRNGIFPWYEASQPLLWWSPDPRFVLYADRLRIPRSLNRVLRGGRFSVTFDREFRKVMEACRLTPRRGQSGTWITPGMIDAYCRLHEDGYAHSVEVWSSGRIVGGLYGVSLGRVFSGESMFSTVPDSSKVGLAALVRKLLTLDVRLIDCQVHTPHLERLGAREIPRRMFLREWRARAAQETHRGRWCG